MDAGFFSSVTSFKFTSRKHRISDDDAVDRVNSFYAPVLIIIASTIIMTKMYLIGDPIQCWIPPHFHSSWEQFAENYCWVKNTYFVPPNETIPDSELKKQQQELNYYQWVPFVLAIQAMLFYVPNLLWKLLNWQSGVQLKSLVSMASQVVQDNQEKRDEQAATVASHLEMTFVTEEPERFGICARIGQLVRRFVCCGYAKSGRYLTIVYLFTKLLYLANAIGQFYLLSAFLGTKYRFYGIEMLADLINNRDWRDTGHFPRVTLCDFSIRAVGNTHDYTLQCVLVVNLLNEKIFIFIWFLLVLVTTVTAINTIQWLLWALLPSQRYQSLEKFVKPKSAAEAIELRRFSRLHMKPDGAFVLRMLSKNVGGPVTHDIVKQLWSRYRQRQKDEESAAASSDQQSEREGEGVFV